MREWLKRSLIVFVAVAFVVSAFIGMAAFDFWRQNNYKSEIQTLQVPGLNIQFVLLTDIAGYEDRAWYVYQLPVGMGLTKRMKTGHDREGVLFWNYSEAGDHYDDPKIEFLKQKYLVFSRGGLYHSLYNIETGQVIVNDESPWYSYISSKDRSGGYPADDERSKEMDAWVHKNLHSKIENILNDAL